MTETTIGSMFSIGYYDNKKIYDSDLVSKVNKVKELMDRIDPASPFGKVFLEKVGKNVTDLINMIEVKYQESYRNDGTKAHTIFHQVFNESFKLRNRFPGGNFTFGDKKTNIMPVLEGTLRHLRTLSAILRSGWRGTHGAYVTELKKSIDEILKLLPEQQEETRMIKEWHQRRSFRQMRNENEQPEEDKEAHLEDEISEEETPAYQLVERTFLYEPFLITVKAALGDAILAKRAASTQQKTISKPVPQQKEYHQNEYPRKMKTSNTKMTDEKASSDEWKVVEGKNKKK
jgi:hypothetical protein